MGSSAVCRPSQPNSSVFQSISLLHPEMRRSHPASDRQNPYRHAYRRRPVGSGFVASLSRPGGNITGLSALASDMASKRVELLKEVVPRASHLDGAQMTSIA
jgi:ABC transporter substrate binding protein